MSTGGTVRNDEKSLLEEVKKYDLLQ